MHGFHITHDLQGCAPRQPALLSDLEALRVLCLGAVAATGLHPVGQVFHRFPAPGGVTGVVLLAESHLALHTWPELAAVTLDVYVCNMRADHTAQALALCDQLRTAFAPQQVVENRVQRGTLTSL